MRHPLVVALAVAVLPHAALARPLADPPPWVLPVNALAKARAGDWTLLEGDAVLGGKLVHEREIIRVAAVKDGVAQLELYEGKAGAEGWILTFPVDLKRGPDSNLLYDLPWIASEPTTSPATCTLGAATFACIEVRYHTPSHEVVARLAPQIRGSGLVSFTVTEAGKPVWTMTTIGYGSGRKVLWGAGPPRADLEAWDGGAQPVKDREGTVTATGDIYETAEDVARAMAPHATVTMCKVTGAAREALVRRMVERKLPPIEDCYSDALAAHPKLGGGPVELRFQLAEGVPTAIDAQSACAPAAACVRDAIANMELDATADAQVACSLVVEPGRGRTEGAAGARPRLLLKAHPARGGPDLRGLPRVP